jgi:hypothetical protein
VNGGRGAFRPKVTTPTVVKLGRRYSLHHAGGWYVVFDDKRPSQPGERYPVRERGQALNRYRELEGRHRRRRDAWVAVPVVGVLCVAGLLKAVADADSHPLAGAISVETDPNGVPYVAFIPNPGGTEGAPVNIADDARGTSALLQLLPVGDLAFGGPIFLEETVPHPGPGPDPGPGPQPRPNPSPGPGPSPSPTPEPPSPTPGPSLTMTDSPPTTTEPSTTVEPEPTMTTEPSPTTDPSSITETPPVTESPEPTKTKTKTKPPKP